MLTLRGVVAPTMSSKFDVAGLISRRAGRELQDGDILVISSKFVATAEGRVVPLRGVKVGASARVVAERYRIDPRLCELVLRESDEVLGGVPGFLLTLKDGLLTPNAGIDKSNVVHGHVVLYPVHPADSAKQIVDAIRFFLGISVGVVICDSRLSPTRRGTTGVAVAACGIEGILDMRGKPDLFGNILRVTSQAVADDLSSAAQLLMGESDEAIPVVIVRGAGKSIASDTVYDSNRFAIPAEECVYMRSLGHSGRKRRPEYAFKQLDVKVRN